MKVVYNKNKKIAKVMGKLKETITVTNHTTGESIEETILGINQLYDLVKDLGGVIGLEATTVETRDSVNDKLIIHIT